MNTRRWLMAIAMTGLALQGCSRCEDPQQGYTAPRHKRTWRITLYTNSQQPIQTWVVDHCSMLGRNRVMFRVNGKRVAVMGNVIVEEQ